MHLANAHKQKKEEYQRCF